MPKNFRANEREKTSQYHTPQLCFLILADLTPKENFEQLFNFQGPVISECTIGVAFQAAHGRAKHVDFSADRKKFGSALHEDGSSTMLAWKVEVKREAAEKKLQKCH